MNKQKFIPAALLFLSVLSVFYLFDSRIKLAEEYNSELQAAREDADNGVMTKAVEEYKNAIQLHPSVDLYIEVAEKYLQNNERRNAEYWYEDVILMNFPNDPKTYEYGLKLYITDEDYMKTFQLYDSFQKRKLSSNTVNELISSVWYKFSLTGSYANVKPFSASGFAEVEESEGKWGFIQGRGYSEVGEDYDYASAFINDSASVIKNGKAYFINTRGETVLTPDYFLKNTETVKEIKMFGDVQSDIVPAFDGQTWHYFDSKTYQYLFGGFKEGTSITAGIAAVSNDDRMWALIDASGNQITEYVFGSIALDERGYPCRNESLIAEKDGYYILIDRKGNQLTDNKYEDAYGFNDDTYAAVRKNGKWIFIDTEGNEYDLGDYQEAHSFCGGLAAVKKDNYWGYIDLEGNIVIDCQFTDARMINENGLGFVKDENNKWRLLSLYSKNHE